MAEADEGARIAEVFDDWARRGRAERMRNAHGPAARMAFERLDLRPDGRYLEIGCGNGYAVRWAARACPDGLAMGIDAAREMIRKARELSAGLDNVEFRCGLFPGVALPATRFDAIFSMETLYYLPEPALDAALSEVARLLVPGGRFACVVNYYGENEASHGWPEEVGLEMTLLDAAGWRRAFERAGLEVVEQARLVVAPDLATAEWHTTEGSLLTLGTPG
jgi:SAM-dependent methyltransferase